MICTTFEGGAAGGCARGGGGDGPGAGADGILRAGAGGAGGAGQDCDGGTMALLWRSMEKIMVHLWI